MLLAFLLPQSGEENLVAAAASARIARHKLTPTGLLSTAYRRTAAYNVGAAAQHLKDISLRANGLVKVLEFEDELVTRDR
jgi:hypothetical protein